MNKLGLLYLASAIFFVMLAGCSNPADPPSPIVYKAKMIIEPVNEYMRQLNVYNGDWYTITSGDTGTLYVFAVTDVDSQTAIQLDSLIVVTSDTSLHITPYSTWHGYKIFRLYCSNSTIVNQRGWQQISVSLRGTGQALGSRFTVEKNIIIHIQKRIFSYDLYHIDSYDSTGQVCHSDTGILKQYGTQIFYEKIPGNFSYDHWYDRRWVFNLVYQCTWDPPSAYAYDWVIYAHLLNDTSYACAFTGFYKDVPYDTLEGVIYGYPSQKIVIRIFP